MGKPDKAVFHSSRNACRPAPGRGARPGTLSFRPKVSFPFCFRSPAGDGVSSLPAVIFCILENRAAHHSLGARPTELPDDRTRGLRSADPGIGGRHGEESFFEVPVVPFV